MNSLSPSSESTRPCCLSRRKIPKDAEPNLALMCIYDVAAEFEMPVWQLIKQQLNLVFPFWMSFNKVCISGLTKRVFDHAVDYS